MKNQSYFPKQIIDQFVVSAVLVETEQGQDSSPEIGLGGIKREGKGTNSTSHQGYTFAFLALHGRGKR